MGIVYAEITLRNFIDSAMVKRGVMKESEIREKTVTAMVDTGAATLVINEDLRQHLGLEVEKTYKATLADGTKQVYSMTEPVQIQWKDRDHVCQAVLIGRRGSIPRSLPRFIKQHLLGFFKNIGCRGMAPASTINFLSKESPQRLAAGRFITRKLEPLYG